MKRSEDPQEFIPQSHSKEKQIVTKENDIFSKKQKIEYKKFNLIQNTRSLIKEEIIHKMYPVKVMSTLDEDIGLDDFSINDFISDNLQEVFLPWPLTLSNSGFFHNFVSRGGNPPPLARAIARAI